MYQATASVRVTDPFGDDADDDDASEVTLAGGMLALSPRVVADAMLAAALRSEADLVALEPQRHTCSLVVKRGSGSLGAFALSPEVGMAAALRVLAAASIDPVALPTGATSSEAVNRVRVRVGGVSGELLVCARARAEGLAVEVRPLTIAGRAPPRSARPQLRRCPACGAYQAYSSERCDADGAEFVDVYDRAEPGGSIGVYKLEGRLGEGGMGVVLAGVHAFLGHRVAIKLLHRSMDEDPVVSRRFLSEARAAASIRHPNVVGVLDYGLLTDGRAFIVMDRIDGEPLEKRLERDVRLEATAALLLAREIAEALAASHAHGVVHLDLKPANVILLDGSTDGAPRIKLIDFGAAARAGRAEDVALLVGTPAYMSPEHARGEPPDPRSDVYSLGVVLFELLSGRRPFDFPDTWQTFRAHMFDPPPRVDTATTPLPEAVHALIARALKKKPDERHQTAEELIAEIDLALRTMSRSTWLRWLP